jgi:hypothetical protein
MSRGSMTFVTELAEQENVTHKKNTTNEIFPETIMVL